MLPDYIPSDMLEKAYKYNAFFAINFISGRCFFKF